METKNKKMETKNYESDKIDNVMATKAYRTFDGKKYTLYSSGNKKKVDDYLKKYGIPKNARYRKIKVGNEYRLYMRFSK